MDKKTEIFLAARDLFFSRGFKNTNISEIAGKAGVGVGTFYNYYSSKEEIFLEIYMKENEDLKKRIMGSLDMNDEPIVLVTKMILQNYKEMNSNMILKEWYNKELFERLEKFFYKKGGFQSIVEYMNEGRFELIKKWKAEGKIRKDFSDEMISAIFDAIPYIDVHKKDIGLQFFPDIITYITEFIMKGLMDFPGEKK